MTQLNDHFDDLPRDRDEAGRRAGEVQSATIQRLLTVTHESPSAQHGCRAGRPPAPAGGIP